MLGEIIWWHPGKNHGVVAVVTDDGMVEKFFLLPSKIARSPEIIKTGQYVKFETFRPAPKPGLLPIAQGVEVSNVPFPDHGAAALAAPRAKQETDQSAPPTPHSKE